MVWKEPFFVTFAFGPVIRRGLAQVAVCLNPVLDRYSRLVREAGWIELDRRVIGCYVRSLGWGVSAVTAERGFQTVVGGDPWA